MRIAARRVSLFLNAALAANLLAQPHAPFRVQSEVVHRELRTDSCWFHPRAAAIPGHGVKEQPAVIVTIQKHLGADDHYSGLFFLRTNDLGKTWSGPHEIESLRWQKESEGVTVAVADVTPGWHARSAKMLAIGVKVRYDARGAQLLDRPRSHECAYAVFDPQRNSWSGWRFLEMPDTDGKFYLVTPGCVQWLTEPDGTILLPVYYRGPSGSDYSVTTLRCRFDGAKLEYLEHGDELVLTGGRGLCEPSMIAVSGEYFLTLRNDRRGYVTRGKDGLHWEPIQPWRFDDEAELGSYNTQQHWLTDGERLALAYTRRGAGNDHIPRNRAPIFVAEVDRSTLRVRRSTERIAIPERGAMLGNFGVAAIDRTQSWVTDAEFLLADRPHPRGADGSVFLARVIWNH